VYADANMSFSSIGRGGGSIVSLGAAGALVSVLDAERNSGISPVSDTEGAIVVA